jgi:outer membrane lipoprotein-sorting protein
VSELRSDDEVDRLLREALADDLPEALESELRREARRAWRRAASEPRRGRWPEWLGVPATWRPLLPQPALVAAALAMLAAGAVMQAAPAPPEVVESFRGRQASARVARALGRATAMECTVDLAGEGGQRLRYRVSWRAPGETRVRREEPAGSSEHTVHLPGNGSSVLMRAARRDTALVDPVLRPARAFLSPSALAERLDAPWRPAPTPDRTPPGVAVFLVGTPGRGQGVTIDTATHLPLRLEATDRDGRAQTAVCRWP